MPGGSKKATVGYKYYLGVHMALAHGPLDSILQVQVDRRIAWSGTATGGPITITANDLFGGDKREGGVSGIVDVEMGLPSQTQNTYLQSQLGTDIPAFRGVAAAVLNQCYMGNNPYLKPWAFLASRIHKTGADGSTQWLDDLSQVNVREVDGVAGCGSEYSCSALYDAITGCSGVVAYYPMGTAGQDIANIAGTSIPAAIGGPLTIGGGADGYSNITPGNFGDSACDGSYSLRIAADATSPGKVTETDHGIQEGIGDLALGDGVFFGMVVKPRSASGASTFLNEGNIEFATAGFAGSAILPNYKLPVGWSYGVSAGSTSDLRDVFMTNSMASNPNSGGGTLILDDALTISDDVPYLLIFKYQLDPDLFEDANTNNEPAYSLSMGIEVWSTDGTVQTASASVWEVIGYGAGADPEDFAPLTRTLSPNTTPSDTALTQLFSAASDSPDLSDFVVFSSTCRPTVIDGFLRSFNTYDPDNNPFSSGGNPACGDGTCGDMNPVHIIRECLTNDVWGLGYAESDIDNTSFSAEALVLIEEGMGISILWERESPLEDFIGEILRHIDGVLYVSRETGKFVIKLIRAETPTLTLDETNVSDVTGAKRPTVSELTNSVSVVYWDYDTDENASVTIHNEALRQLQGVAIATTLQYPGFSNRDIATRVAERDLRSLCTPLLSCEITANREAASLNIGDAFTLDWPDLHINSTTMRVSEIDFGDGITNAVRIKAVQDVFSTPTIAIQSQPTEVWVDPVTIQPEAAVARVVTETPYYPLVLELGEGPANDILTADNDAGFLLASGGRALSEINANVFVDAGAGYVNSATADFHPYAYLSASIGETDETITIESGKDLDLVAAGSVAQIGDELVRVDSVNVDGSGNYVSVTVGRGILDTVPAAHTVSSPNTTTIAFWGDFAVSDNEQYVAAESIDVKLQTVRGASLLSTSTAPVDSVTMDSRAYRPYPPGDLKIDSVSYPDITGSPEPLWTATHTVTWAHRDRTQQTDGNLYDYTDTNIGPEAGTTYRIDVYSTLVDTTDTAPWWTLNVGSVNTYTMGSESPEIPTPPVNTAVINIKVTAVRDGYDSWQSPVAKLLP